MNVTDLHPARPDLREAAIERFWSRVDIRSENECWEYQGSRSYFGKARLNYGVTALGYSSTGNRRSVTAHRAAYLFTHGEIADELFVCHSCDNPPCCNPAHLWAGTPGENAEDRNRKGRTRAPKARRGAEVGNAKLTDDLVVFARRCMAKGIPLVLIAKTLKMSGPGLSVVVRGIGWSHVDEPVVTKDHILTVGNAFKLGSESYRTGIRAELECMKVRHAKVLEAA